MWFALCIQAAVTFATESDELESIARPLGANEVYYRWQSTAASENLLKAKRMTPTLDAHFMKHVGAAGPGLYVASTPASSASYLPEEGGGLIEVRFTPGTRVIDLTEDATQEFMRKRGLRPGQILDQFGENVPGILKYTSEWYVGKNLSGHAEFSAWPNASHTAADLTRTLKSIVTGTHTDEQQTRAETAIARQIATYRPDLARAIAEGHALDVPLLRALPKAEAIAAIRTYQTTSSLAFQSAVVNVHRYLAEEPGMLTELARDPVAFDKVADTLVEATQRNMIKLNPEEYGLMNELILGHAGEPSLRATRIKKMVEVTMHDQDLWQNLDVAESRVLPLLRAADLSSEQRTALARRIANLVAAGVPLGADDLARARALAQHAGPAAADLQTRIDAAGRPPAAAAAARSRNCVYDLFRTYGR